MPFEIDSTCSNSCERKHFRDFKPGTHLKLLKLICDVQRSFRNLTANLRPQRSLPYLDLFLVVSLVLLAILSPVMASSLSLVAPDGVDVSGRAATKWSLSPVRMPAICLLYSRFLRGSAMQEIRASSWTARHHPASRPRAANR